VTSGRGLQLTLPTLKLLQEKAEHFETQYEAFNPDHFSAFDFTVSVERVRCKKEKTPCPLQKLVSSPDSLNPKILWHRRHAMVR
jgi:hypothetical protein